MRVTTALCLLALGAAPAFAGQAEATSCAAGLDAHAKLIFDTALPQVSTGADLKAVVTDTTKTLVKAGLLPRSEARPEPRLRAPA